MIFLIPVTIPELTASKNIFLSVRLPGGATIIFPKKWNFATKKNALAQFLEKITSTAQQMHNLYSKTRKITFVELEKFQWNS